MASTTSESSAPTVANQTFVAKATHFPYGYTLEGCLNPRMLFFLDPEVAQANLPPGYKAADAVGLMRYLGFPQPPSIATGRAVAGYDFLGCDKASFNVGPAHFSQVGIFIDAPKMGNDTTQATNLDLYLLSMATDSPSWRNLLVESGFPAELVLNATIKSNQDILPGDVYSGHGDVSLGSRLATADWSGQDTGGPLAIHARYWHSTSAGTVFLDFNLDERVSAGAITACTHAAGSTYETATDTKSCGPEPRFAAVGVEGKIEGGIHSAPGRQPQ